MSSDIAIRASGLTKEFKNLKGPFRQLLNVFGVAPTGFVARKQVLKGLDFTVRRGEKIGILGMNGAGKSTLLQIIAGNSVPTQGSLDVYGNIGAILELGAGFHAELTGRQNAETQLLLAGVDWSDLPRLMQRIIDFSGLGTDIDVKTRTYSSGMMVRLAFAVATSGNPDIFIVDEALAVGDAAFQQKCYNHIHTELADATIVLISHDLAAISALCDRVIVLDGGHIAFDGAPSAAIPLYNRLVQGAVAERDQVRVFSDGQVDDACKSGPRELDIRKVALRINGIDGTVAHSDDLVEIIYEIENRGEPRDFIFGFNVLDMRGQVLFGQNTEKAGPHPARSGMTELALSFRWPRIAPGTYFMTVGVASSLYGVNTIQCWANQVFQIQNILDEGSHGLFNVSLTEVRVG
ncbi:ATP-binding cassette domain-containing protein [Agrobacterium salinitolerans]|nr:ATP-binding cassette domain-containing protein [Agrobacterium salinitolerans]